MRQPLTPTRPARRQVLPRRPSCAEGREQTQNRTVFLSACKKRLPFPATFTTLAWGFPSSSSLPATPPPVVPFFENPTEISVQLAWGHGLPAGARLTPPPSCRISNNNHPSVSQTLRFISGGAGEGVDRPRSRHGDICTPVGHRISMGLVT